MAYSTFERFPDEMDMMQLEITLRNFESTYVSSTRYNGHLRRQQVVFSTETLLLTEYDESRKYANFICKTNNASSHQENGRYFSFSWSAGRVFANTLRGFIIEIMATEA